MMKLPDFVDMALGETEQKEMYSSPVSPDMPKYPYGLSICLSQDELEKLNLTDDCEPGDMLHLFCLAKVTSVSKNDTQDGTKMRVEMQITHIAAEDEGDENEEMEDKMPRKLDYNKFYER